MNTQVKAIVFKIILLVILIILLVVAVSFKQSFNKPQLDVALDAALDTSDTEKAKAESDAYRQQLRDVPNKKIVDKDCVAYHNQTTCVLRMSESEPGYTFVLDFKTHTIEVKKDDVILQKMDTHGEYEMGYAPGISIPGTMSLVDVNFDGYNDLSVLAGGGQHGSFYTYYLFNPKTKLFEFSKDFSDTAAIPDKETKLLIHHGYLGCAGNCFEEERYKVVNNKPLLIQEIKQENILNAKGMYSVDSYTRVTRELVGPTWVTSTTTNKGF